MTSTASPALSRTVPDPGTAGPTAAPGDPPPRRTGPPELDGARDAESLLARAFAHFGDRIAVVTAFQAEGIVLLDLARRLRPDVRVITLDTGRLPAETHDLIDRVRRRLGIAVEIVHPDAGALADLVGRHGPNLFRDGLDLRLACCRVRKVEPLERALAGLDAWITGLRRDQSAERRETPRVSVEPASGRTKLAPLADWSEARVWRWIRENDLPYHPFYDAGYRTIGCAPCTRPVRIGEPARSGRWWWEEDGEKKECGLHLRPVAAPRSARQGGA